MLDRFREWGGVVEYVLIDCELDIDAEEIHALAVWFGMVVVRGRRDRDAAAQHAFGSEGGLPPRPVLRRSEPRRSEPETVSSFMQQYHSAFIHPPAPEDDFARPFRPPSEELPTLFSPINTLIFGEFSTWSIRRWNTDWTSHFDGGRRRWGAYLWTLAHENRKHCVWVGATAD